MKREEKQATPFSREDEPPRTSRLPAAVALGLFLVELLVILTSWVYSAVSPMSGVRSLLSGEGLRWLMGSFADMLATPLLVWLLLLAMAYGVLRRSGMLTRPSKSSLLSGYRQRRARLSAVLLFLLILVVMLLLTVIPHAILLSATGGLWPSPFSHSLVPVVAFTVISVSACYGLMAGTFPTLNSVYQALQDGLSKAAPLFLYYVLLMQIYESLRFAFF